MKIKNTVMFAIVALITLGVSILVINYLRKLRIQSAKKEAEKIEKERVRLELEETKRLKDKAVIEALHTDIKALHRQFEKFLSYNDGYFNNKKLLLWKSSVAPIYEILKKYDISSLKLEANFFSEIEELKKNYDNGEYIRKNFNPKLIASELNACETLFANIEGQVLDEQQRLAIVKDEDNNLVIAGAGSGKTTTVAGKVVYVLDRLKIKPEQILLITFTRKASDEMKHRIRQKMGIDIEVNTFHSFGRKVIGEVTNDMPSVIEEKLFYTAMKNIFRTLFENDSFAEKVIKFITEYRLEVKVDTEFKNHGEYIDYIKENNIKTYKTNEVYINGRTTILRETCKSIDEVKIANFLFLNGIEYRYEEPYKFKTSDNLYAQYRPDFYLPDYDIYIEHFGLIDEEGNVPAWFNPGNHPSAKVKYNTDILWKRDLHSKYETNLIETFSYENSKGVLFENLRKALERKGVLFKPRTKEEIWQILNSVAKEEVNTLDTLISTFLSLFKSNNFAISQLTAEIQSISDSRRRARYLLFLDIFSPILSSYTQFLKSRNLIDFSDMINQASHYVSNKKFKNKYRYIIVDEFQDTSIGRFNLIKALLNDNMECKLFAVGDDWQSIYRFAGSDISLFTEFEKHFGVTEYSKIETTYRFGKSMIDLSSRFILTNPNQTSKELKPFSNDINNPVEIIAGNNLRNEDPESLITALQQIKSENPIPSKKLTILALARYNHILELYKERNDLFAVKYNEQNKNFIIICLEMPEFEIQFLTIHRSKGLQADYVIILNCVSGQFGFPSEQADDPILNLLLSKSDQFLNGEERRLFYVALTRSKKKTYITTNTSYTSKFVNEIALNFSQDPNIKCPLCKSGKQLKQEGINKNGNPYKKYTCSNWKMGCEYLAWG